MTTEAATGGLRAVRGTPRRVLVAGLGVSGLSAAHFLFVHGALRAGDTLVLRDAEAGVGGVLSHTARDGYLLEHGAQGVLASRAAFTSLVRALGLEGECIGSSSRAKARYLALPRGGLVRLSPWPFPYVRAGLFGWGAWWRAVCEWRVPARRVPDPAETLYGFFARRFGEAIARRVAIPMATGIWAGGARAILVAKAFPRLVEWETARGGVIRGALSLVFGRQSNRTEGAKALATPEPPPLPRGLLTFREGMIALPRTLLADVERRARHTGVRIELVRGGPISRVDGGSGSGPLVDGERYDAAILAFPPWSAHAVTWDHSPTRPHWESLRNGLTRHGVVVVGIGGTLPAGFKPARGFGALAPEESTLLLGILNVHDINPSHVPSPDGSHVLYRLLLGGDRAPDAVHEPADSLLAAARTELARLGLVPAGFDPAFEELVRWPGCIALPDARHAELVPCVAALEEGLPGLHLAGNYVRGVGVADCIERAEDVARAVAARLGAGSP